MLDCRGATELAQSGLDRRLSHWARFTLGLHRLLCGPCRVYKRQIAQLRRLTLQLRGADEGGPRLATTARERIRARLSSASDE